MKRYAKYIKTEISHYIVICQDTGLSYYCIDKFGVSELLGPYHEIKNFDMYINRGYTEISKEEFEAYLEL